MIQRGKVQPLNLLLWLVLCFIAILFIILNIITPQVSIKLTNSIKTPIVNVKYFFSSYLPSSLTTFFNNAQVVEQLKEENKSLEKQISFLKEDNLKLNILRMQNEILSYTLNVKSDMNISSIYTVHVEYVNYKDMGSFNKNFIARVGLNDGIEKGLLVVSNKGVIGVVSATYDDVSDIKTILDPSFKLSAHSEQTKTNVVVSGNNTITPDVLVYTENINLKEGELIFTSGLEGIFPNFLPIGHVFKDSNGRWKVRLLENFNGITYIHIVRK